MPNPGDPSSFRLGGIIAAAHAPFAPSGSVHLPAIEGQARHLIESGVRGVFINGSTGEFPALTFEERDAIARRWLEVTRGTTLKTIVHVGGCQVEAGVELARRAASAGTGAIAALAPFYFRPTSIESVVDCCEVLAAGAPEVPFYYYDIPELTGIRHSPKELLVQARERVPTFAGIKFTSPDLMALQECIEVAGDELDVLFGQDENLLAGLALGAGGAVGSSYNFAAGLYDELCLAFERGDLEGARERQRKSVRLIRTLASNGYMAACKQVMSWLEVDLGPPRLPARMLAPEDALRLREELEEMGFFEWRLYESEARPTW